MTEREPTTPATTCKPWLVRIPEIFEGIAGEVLRRFGAVSSTRLGHDYYLIKTPAPETVQHSEAAKFARWNLPMDHTWPCNAQKMDGFIEKAAQTLLKKFGERNPQGIFIGTLQPTSPDKYYKGLASNLRGRVLQLFPKLPASTVEEQNPTAETLFCLVGKEGLFCGMQSPRSSNGLYAGGSKYIDQDAPDTISRAGAKIAEALHYLLLIPPAARGRQSLARTGGLPGRDDIRTAGPRPTRDGDRSCAAGQTARWPARTEVCAQ
jgi:23S rRNA (cytidine2498-2'-O)-methyltransferase